MEQVDCVVIGAGVIGLAVAREMSLQGRETIILERESAFGTVSSARNSEVMHAGIYYPKDSLKAQLCVEGNRLLYEYCRSHQVETQAYGKLVVAADDEQINDLQNILYKAQNNGVPNVRLLSSAEALNLEPDLKCTAAMLSSSTGIVDSHGFMLSLLGGFEDAGGMIAYQSPLLTAHVVNDGFELAVGAELPPSSLVSASGAVHVEVRSSHSRPPTPSSCRSAPSRMRISSAIAAFSVARRWRDQALFPALPFSELSSA